MKYLVVDVETTMKNKGEDKRGTFAASPFHPDNHIVYLGSMNVESGEYEYMSLAKGEMLKTTDFDVIIGHNLKFDLHYIHKQTNPSLIDWVRGGGMIWDTMVAEYVLSGQSRTTKEKGALSLDGLCDKYSLPLKDNKVKEYFDAGMGADEIPEEEILPYLEGDVRATTELFKSQANAAIAVGMMPLIQNMMEATLATWLMEVEGSVIDTAGLRAYGDSIAANIDLLKSSITAAVVGSTVDFNPMSDQQLSSYFFGGILKYNYDEVVVDEEGVAVRYKSGKRKGEVKTRKAVGEHVLPRLVNPEDVGAEKRKAGWAVTDEVLKNILNKSGGGGERLVARDVIKLRGLSKDLTTYVDGYLSRVWHDGKLHPEFNMTRTGTGRLSCSNPNLQNIKSGR